MATLRRRRHRSGHEVWVLYWTEPGASGPRGQRQRAVGTVAEVTEAQARIALAALKVQLDRDGRRSTPERRQVPTFREWTVTYLIWHEREYPSSHFRVRQILEQWLVPVFGDHRLDEMKRADLETYKVGRDAAPRTVAKELRTMQAAMNTAADWEVIDRNPVKGVRPPQDLDDAPARYFTRDELARLCEASRYRGAWWRLMANTGLRRGEALGLQWEDWQGDVLRIVSTSQARTKAGRSRAVPLNTAAKKALAAIKAEPAHSIHQAAAYVLPRMVPRSLSRHFEEDAARAGLLGTIHDLRHTFCTQLVLAGVHLRKVQLLAGHSTVRVTERYAKLLGSDLAADIRRLRL